MALIILYLVYTQVSTVVSAEPGRRGARKAGEGTAPVGSRQNCPPPPALRVSDTH